MVPIPCRRSQPMDGGGSGVGGQHHPGGRDLTVGGAHHHRGTGARPAGCQALDPRVLVDADPGPFTRGPQPPGQSRRVDQGAAVGLPQSAQVQGGVDLRPELVPSEENGVATVLEGQGLGLAQPVDLVGLRRDVQLARALEVALDSLGGHRGLDGVEIGAAEPLERPDLVGEPLDAVAQAMGDAGGAEAAVATGSRPAAAIALEHHDVT